MNNKRASALVFILGIILLLSGSVSAKDEWLNVRSKNFNLIGNASDKQIRRVATKLEEFREAFRLLFAGTNLNAPIPTNVVVFKSDSSYTPFKPKRADGKTDTFLAGYFQPGEDVNYITLAAGGVESDTFGTIFHEYVHFIVNTNIGKSEVPPWFNEGLAEYYQTFEMEDDIKAKLGLPQAGHLNLLRENKLIPLDAFFKVSNFGLLQQGSHSRSIFYAEAWAMIHYLIANKKSEGMSKFLTDTMKNVPPETAFRDAFQMTYAQMESELRKYVSRATYQYTTATFKNKLVFETDMVTTPLSDADMNAYLGDLLFHTNRADDAEPFLQKALTLDPDSGMANTTLGVVKVRQRKFDDAKKYLERAISKDPKNHIAYYQYAYLLSREDRDEFGYVSAFPAEKAAKMRTLLKKAIEIDPAFTESYEMLAFLSLVTNEGLDDGVAAMQKALRLQPGSQRYSMRLAELYMRQDKFELAASIAEKVSKTADEPDVKSQADELIDQMKRRQDVISRNEENRKRIEAARSAGPAEEAARPRLTVRGSDPSTQSPVPQPGAQEFMIRAINRDLRKTAAEEIRLIGNLEKIECKGGVVTYTIKSEADNLILTSKDFQGLALATFITDRGDAEIGCGAKVADMKAVLTYRPKTLAKGTARGELVSVEFVPPAFHFVDPVVLDQPDTETSAELLPPPPAASSGPGLDLDSMRRNAMMASIKEAMRKPAADEKQEMGFIERSECSGKGSFFYFRTAAKPLKLSNPAAEKLEIRAFTPDVEHLQFGCGMKAVEVPVVITYKPATDLRSKADGDLISLEFVPKSFVLQ